MQRYTPEIEKRVRWYQGGRSPSLRVDETDVRLGGAWKHLFHAVEETGRLINVLLSDRRDTRAVHRFLGKAPKTMRKWPPVSITTDKRASFPRAMGLSQGDDHLSDGVTHRRSKYLNNMVEADHGALKQVIRREHCGPGELGGAGEVCFVSKRLGLHA